VHVLDKLSSVGGDLQYLARFNGVYTLCIMYVPNARINCIVVLYEYT